MTDKDLSVMLRVSPRNTKDGSTVGPMPGRLTWAFGVKRGICVRTGGWRVTSKPRS